MGISMDSLPPRYQKQAARKLDPAAYEKAFWPQVHDSRGARAVPGADAPGRDPVSRRRRIKAIAKERYSYERIL